MLFFESGDTEVLKLIEISCLQVIKGKLTVRLTKSGCLTCFTHICQLCVPTIVEVSLKRFFFLNTGQPPWWKSRRPQNDVYLAFVLTAIIYSSSTLPDYMMSLTLYTPISECKLSVLFSIYFLTCWQGEFIKQSRGS